MNIKLNEEQLKAVDEYKALIDSHDFNVITLKLLQADLANILLARVSVQRVLDEANSENKE